MEKSNSIKNIAAALITFHMKVGKVKKDSMNPHFKKKYASLSSILETIADALTESGLTFTQFPCDENALTTILIHAESGEFIQSTYIMKPSRPDPQGIGSAITYQRRYALAAILGLNVDEDDDANTASEKVETKQEKPGLSAEAFQKVLARINEGEKLFEKTDSYYALTPAQRKTLKEAEKNFSPFQTA